MGFFQAVIDGVERGFDGILKLCQSNGRLVGIYVAKQVESVTGTSPLRMLSRVSFSDPSLDSPAAIASRADCKISIVFCTFVIPCDDLNFFKSRSCSFWTRSMAALELGLGLRGVLGAEKVR